MKLLALFIISILIFPSAYVIIRLVVELGRTWTDTDGEE
jgi:hypothetical protein